MSNTNEVKEIKCLMCGCVVEYENNDVQIGEDYNFLVCPNCDCDIPIGKINYGGNK